MSQQDMDRPHAESIAALAEARERMGWSLVQAAERMHLDVATVRALEAGQFDSLGATVFARGHLRRYAELLGLPAAEVESICAWASHAARQPDLRRTVGALKDSGPGAWRPAAAAIGALIVVLLALIWWAMRVPNPRAHAAAAPNASAAPDAAATPNAAAASAAGAQSTPPGSAAANPAAAADSKGGSADMPLLKAATPPGKLLSEPAPGGLETRSPQPAPSPAAAPHPRAHAARP